MSGPERFNAAEAFVDAHVHAGRGGRTAIRFEGRAITYAELAEMSGRAALALASLGVEMEHRVLMVLADSPAFAAAFWGAAKLGAVAVPVNPVTPDADLAFILADSRARVVLADEAHVARLLSLRAASPLLRAVVGVEAATGGAPGGALGGASRGAACEGGGAARAPRGAVSWREALAAARGTPPPAPTVSDDVMYWGYTSGSTGRPKAAPHTHADFLAAAELVGVGVFGLGPDDVTYSASKMSFAFGLGNSLYFPAHVGAASVLVAERSEPERVLETIARERPSVFFAVPSLYARMLEVPGKQDLGSLRLCVSSGEALPVPVFDAWRDRFGMELCDVVGSTEALHDFIATRPGAVRRGATGQVVPGFEARLVDDDGQPVASGAPGHLLVKGPTTALGYWRRPERTRVTMLGEWLRTGDMFREDDDGYFYFEGRSDDMLKVGGQWVSPAEVEACLLAHPDVVEAGVVGRADADGLTRPCAFVALRPGLTGDEALASRLRGFVHGRLPGFKVPRWIEVVDELPKTATGKIQRFLLRGRR